MSTISGSVVKEYPLDRICRIDGRALCYLDDSQAVCRIDLKRSRRIWWDKHLSASAWYAPLGRWRNKYTGCRLKTADRAFIRLYTEDGEVIFCLELPSDRTSQAYADCENRWVGMVNEFTRSGFWLFDEG